MIDGFICLWNDSTFFFPLVLVYTADFLCVVVSLSRSEDLRTEDVVCR